MSYVLIDAILRRSTLGWRDRWLLAVLATWANGTGECWPTVPAIARRAGWSRMSVFRGLARLEAAGAIAVQRRHRRPNRYQILEPR